MGRFDRRYQGVRYGRCNRGKGKGRGWSARDGSTTGTKRTDASTTVLPACRRQMDAQAEPGPVSRGDRPDWEGHDELTSATLSGDRLSKDPSELLRAVKDFIFAESSAVSQEPPATGRPARSNTGASQVSGLAAQSNPISPVESARHAATASIASQDSFASATSEIRESTTWDLEVRLRPAERIPVFQQPFGRQLLALPPDQS